jgi:hypothetical protein
MARIPTLVAGLAIASAAFSQQTTHHTQTLGPVATLVTTPGQAVLDFVAAGTPVGSGPQSLNLSTRIDQGTYVSSTTIAYPTLPHDDGIGLNFFERAYARGATTDACGTASATGAAGAQLGPHSLLLTFADVPGTRGKLIFQFRASAGTTGTVGAALDIGNDGNFEVQAGAATTLEFSLTIPSSGALLVRVDNECHVAGAGSSSFQSCWTELWVGFRPDRTATCTISNYGQGCGPAATGTDTVIGSNRVLTVLITSAFPQEPVIAITGANRIQLPLPGGCALLSSLDVAQLVVADANGLATHSMVMPATLVGTSFHQFVPVRLQGQNLVIQTSEGVQVACR